MKKFTKVLESKLNSDDIKDIFLSLEDIGCGVDIRDGYLNNYSSTDVHANTNFFSDDEWINQHTRYAKFISITTNINDHNINFSDWDKMGMNRSSMSFISKNGFTKHKTLINEVVDCLNRLDVDFFIKLDASSFKIMIVGDVISSDLLNKKRDMEEACKFLCDGIEKYVYSKYKKSSFVSLSKSDIVFKANYRDVEDKKISLELVHSLDPEFKNSNSNKFFNSKELSELKNTINEMGYKINITSATISTMHVYKIKLST